MKIYIVDYNSAENIIVFKTAYGSATGIWMESYRPEQKDYYVEFNLPEIFNISQIKESKLHSFEIRMIGDKIILVGILNEYDEGCATFLIGDSIVMIELSVSKEIMKLIGKYISLTVTTLEIYDEGLV